MFVADDFIQLYRMLFLRAMDSENAYEQRDSALIACKALKKFLMQELSLEEAISLRDRINPLWRQGGVSYISETSLLNIFNMMQSEGVKKVSPVEIQKVIDFITEKTSFKSDAFIAVYKAIHLLSLNLNDSHRGLAGLVCKRMIKFLNQGLTVLERKALLKTITDLWQEDNVIDVIQSAVASVVVALYFNEMNEVDSAEIYDLFASLESIRQAHVYALSLPGAAQVVTLESNNQLAVLSAFIVRTKELWNKMVEMEKQAGDYLEHKEPSEALTAYVDLVSFSQALPASYTSLMEAELIPLMRRIMDRFQSLICFFIECDDIDSARLAHEVVKLKIADKNAAGLTWDQYDAYLSRNALVIVLGCLIRASALEKEGQLRTRVYDTVANEYFKNFCDGILPSEQIKIVLDAFSEREMCRHKVKEQTEPNANAKKPTALRSVKRSHSESEIQELRESAASTVAPHSSMYRQPMTPVTERAVVKSEYKAQQNTNASFSYKQ